jgi:hypothetical protein
MCYAIIEAIATFELITTGAQNLNTPHPGSNSTKKIASKIASKIESKVGAKVGAGSLLSCPGHLLILDNLILSPIL